MQYTFAHFNFNVLDLDRSLAFYKEALGLEPVRTKEAEDGSFRLVYLGDSDTDIPCMKLVNSYGGHPIGVYDPARRQKEKVYRLMKNNRIRYFAPADYSEGGVLDGLLKAIIDKTAAYEKLEAKHVENLEEMRKSGN